MVNLIDTHSHIYAKAFDTDREQMLENARKQGVSKIFMPNIDIESVEGMMELAAQYPDFCIPMMGLHPCSVDADWEKDVDALLDWFQKAEFAAVGEIGMDLYWDKTYQQQQALAFIRQTDFALEKQLPIVIHSRSATPQIMEILQDYKGKGLRGVFHCFSESYEYADEITDMGFYFGIGGVLTFKNSGLAEVVKKLPIDRIILETDAPYLAPVPFRGKRNEPAYLWHVAKLLAEIRAMGLEELGRVTSENALRLFSK